ncbi:hypothetical protein EB837_12210 [Kluyvera ascorbata]|uniref:Uncharacterized protein n=1 Tax=Kluyvera ascorbata TaxID=51288 RepID=A0A3N2S259_9ENTR|nr:hypothetical protein [Kluyvera ascorbata]ROU13816.1 hypothetical protein EB837_12210 [Kluyvera ascorbata]
MYNLADRLGEPDPRKIASLPADILLHWQAWLSLTMPDTGCHPPAPPELSRPPQTEQSQQCADVMRILGK